jgi:hypothetical protein
MVPQEKVNEILTRERRAAEVRYSAQLSRVQQTLEELRASKDLSEESRKSVEARANELAAAKKASDEANEFERKRMQKEYDDKLKAEAEGRKQWENRFKEREIEAVLKSAAEEHDVFLSNQIASLLRPQVEAVQARDEKGQLKAAFDIKVRWQDADPATGQKVEILLSPAAAVKRMKENPKQWGNLFKSGVVSGLGSSSMPASPGGKLDVARLTTEQYMTLRKSNPSALGLRGDRRRKM